MTIITTPDSFDTLGVPAKVRPFLAKAIQRGLTVKHVAAREGQSNYTIDSVNPIDDWSIWLYHTAGRNGGVLDLVRYTPIVTGGRRKPAKKITRVEASIAIDDMGDALDRHHAREAAGRTAQFNAQRDAHADDLNAAVTQFPTRPRTKDPVDTNQNPDGKRELAQTVLAGLRANARFALRIAQGGRIPTNTPAKVRGALVNRGLVVAAGGVLTDLGRVARSLVVA